MSAMKAIKKLMKSVAEFKTQDEWLNARRNYIGGTDVSVLLGVNPWKTPVQLYLDKVEGNNIEENIAMRRGKALEPLVADIYCEKTGNVILNMGRRLFVHPTYGLFAVSLDRLAITPDDKIGVVEIKTAVGFGVEKFRNGIPAIYMSQVQMQLWIMEEWLAQCGYKEPLFADLPVLLDDRFECWSGMQLDEMLVAHMLNAGTKFKENFLDKRIVPAPESMEDIKILYRDVIMGSWMECTDDLYDLLIARKNIKQAIKNQSDPVGELKKKLETLEFNICEMIRENEVVVKDNVEIVTRKADKNGVRKLLVKDHLVVDTDF